MDRGRELTLEMLNGLTRRKEFDLEGRLPLPFAMS